LVIDIAEEKHEFIFKEIKKSLPNKKGKQASNESGSAQAA
jgi:hypothetical protein